MKNLTRILLALLLSWSVIACTTTRAIESVTPATASEKVRPGDKVSITTKAGKEYRFEVVEVTPQAIRGPSASVAYRDIAKLEVTEFSGRKTAGLGLGVYAGILALGLILGHLIARGIEDSFGD